MQIYEMDALAEGYANLLGDLSVGDRVAPRGEPTRELLDVTIKLNEPWDVLLDHTARGRYRPVIGAAEALQLVAGISDPQLMHRITPAFQRYLDGGIFHGAYGPRLRFQLPRILHRLANDPDTRQSVVTVWDPQYDGAGDAERNDAAPRDLPCTVYLAFRIRNQQLTMKTHMRSNDAWLGLPYDFIQFTTLQQTVANVLDVAVGPYVHHVDSLHLYERNMEDASRVVPRPHDAARTLLHGVHGATWVQARLVALELMSPGTTITPEDRSTYHWFNNQLAPYLG